MIVKQLPARGLAQQSQPLDWELPSDFVDQRQRQNSIAQKARLQYQNICPTRISHELQTNRLVDQHDRNIVLDRIHEPASVQIRPSPVSFR